MPQIKRDVTLDLTPEECANAVADMDNEQQALFLNCLANNVFNYASPYEFQLQAIVDCGILSDRAISFMETMADYLKTRNPDKLGPLSLAVIETPYFCDKFFNKDASTKCSTQCSSCIEFEAGMNKIDF